MKTLCIRAIEFPERPKNHDNARSFHRFVFKVYGITKAEQQIFIYADNYRYNIDIGTRSCIYNQCVSILLKGQSSLLKSIRT